MTRSLRMRREVPSGSHANVPAANRRAGGLGNQARLRRLGAPKGELTQPMVAIDPVDSGAPISTVNRDDSASEGVVTYEGGPVTPAPAPGVTPPAPPPPSAPAAAACQCDVASGPTYTPSGAIPVTTSGGRKRARFSLAASFTNNPGAGKPASCCHVRQYIKWDTRFETWAGGPPHSGFGSAPANTWIEDRDTADTRYGHRSGPHSAPAGGCGDEYKTGNTQDMANGDTYCGRDGPNGPDDMVGVFSFQLKVVDSGGAVKQSSSVITVTWG